MRLPWLWFKGRARLTSASASTAPAPSLPSACGATRNAFKSFVNRPLYPPNVTSTLAARRSTTTMLSPSELMVEAEAVNATLHVCVARSSTDVSGTPADESPPPVMYQRPCTTAPACPARFACVSKQISKFSISFSTLNHMLSKGCGEFEKRQLFQCVHVLAQRARGFHV